MRGLEAVSMGLATYRTTGVVMTTLKKLLGVKLSVSGAEHLVDRPTLFVANHFTRIETFLIPYVIFHHAGRVARSLTSLPGGLPMVRQHPVELVHPVLIALFDPCRDEPAQLPLQTFNQARD